MLEIAYRVSDGGRNAFTIGVAALPPDALQYDEDNDVFTFDDDAITDHIEGPTNVRGQKNSTTRLGKLMDKHPKAVELSDTAAVRNALDGDIADDETAAEVDAAGDGGDGADPVDAKDAAKAGDGEDTTDDETKTKLKALGYSTSRIKKLTEEQVETILKWDLPGESTRVIKGKMSINVKKLAEDHAYVVAVTKEKEEAKAAKQAEAAKKRAEKAAAAQAAKTPVAFKVFVVHPDWKAGDPEGKDIAAKRGQRYEVGSHADQAEAQRVADKWAGADLGFTASVEPVYRGKAHGLWEEPFMPIASLIPGDYWVGDHLMPHLKALDTSFQVYVDEYNYPADGPKMSARALAALAKAHNAVRRAHALKLDQLCVDVEGDSAVALLRITKHEGGEGAKAQYQLTVVTATEGSKYNIGDTVSLSHKDIVNSTQTVGRWSATQRKLGADDEEPKGDSEDSDDANEE